MSDLAAIAIQSGNNSLYFAAEQQVAYKMDTLHPSPPLEKTTNRGRAAARPNPYINNGKGSSNGTKSPENVRPLALPAGKKKAEKTAEGYSGGLLYINKFLNEKKFPQFCDLTEEHVEGDHMANFLDNIFHWFATTSFKIPSGWLANSSKETRFKQIKQVFKEKFSRHELMHNEDYWVDTKKWFDKKIKNHRMNDTEVVELRKSVPLYRDLSTRNTAMRAKYLREGPHKTVVDAKTISMALIQRGDKHSCHILSEFNLSRHAIGRGGEHLYLRWNEGTYDEHFQAPDFDWPIIKQTDIQCMLLFCDRYLYCLCTFFGFAVFFLHGGLRRDGVSEATKDFVYPSLHKIRKDGVAARLNDNIRRILKPIFDEVVAKQTTTRSIRRGAMTENRVNRDLSTQEEYARSGHTAADMNINAEGYVGSTPAMNAPAGRALAGYPDPHANCTPYSFECLGTSVVPAVERLIGELFANDVPELQNDKAMYIVVLTSAACLIGAYNHLVKDVASPETNEIIVKIRKAARAAQIEDHRATADGFHRWLVVLKYWSECITDAFTRNNPERVSQNAPLNQQLIGFGSQLESIQHQFQSVADKVESSAKDAIVIASLRESNQMTAKMLEQKQKECDSKDKENKKLKRQLEQMHERQLHMHESMKLCWQSPQSTPQKAASSLSNHNQHDQSHCNNLQHILALADAEESVLDEPSAKKQRMSSHAEDTLSPTHTALIPPPQTPPPSPLTPPPQVNIAALLNGVPNEKKTTTGITLKSELEDKWKSNIFKEKRAEADLDATELRKRALFDVKNHLYLGCNDTFIVCQEKSRYTKAMKLIAMGINADQWDKLIGDELTSVSMRTLVSEVDKQTKAIVRLLEIQYCDRDKDKQFKCTTSLRALGDRFSAILTNVQRQGKKSDYDLELWLSEKLGEGRQSGQQQTIGSYYGK